MSARPGNADIRPWLASHPRATSPYTRTRIGESYDHIDRILERFSGLRHERALDIGCGSGFDTFALAARFERVTAVDASRRRTLTAAILVRRAGIPGIRVQRAKAEDLRSAESYDFVYCNIMSELVSSRRRLAENIAELTAEGAGVYYAEETEAYAPMEIARAIEDRDAVQLRGRLRQVVNGFGGFPWFRFYLAGTAADLFLQYGFETVHARQKSWHNLVYEDAVWLRRVSREVIPPAAADPDYAGQDADFAAMRAEFRAAVAGRRATLSADDANRFAPYLVLLRMAQATLGDSLGEAPSTLERALAYTGRLPPPDWPRMEAGLEEFMQRIGARAGS